MMPKKNKTEDVFALENMSLAINYNKNIYHKFSLYLPTKAIVLDFGAGIGTFSNFLRAEGHQVICVEQDESSIKKLQKNGFTVTELNKIANASLDAIFTSNVLEHIEDDVEILKLFNQKLKSDGILFIYVPACPLLYSEWDRSVGHIRRYTKNELCEKSTCANFKIKKIYYSDGLGFFLTLIIKYFGNTAELPSASKIIFYDKFLFPISKLLDIFMKFFLGKNLFLIAHKN